MSSKGRASSTCVASTEATPAPTDRNGLMVARAHAREGGNIMEMQRRRLLLATGEVVATDGLEDASVGRICKRASMSRRTFYEIFEDREACFLAALEVNVERIAHSVTDAYAREGPTQKTRWHERVRRALAALLECFDSDPGIARLCLVEALKAGPEGLEYRRRILDDLTRAIDAGRHETKHATVEPSSLTAESTVGGVFAVLHARVLAHDPRPLVELLNPLMSMIVHPYLGPAAAKRELKMPLPPNDKNVIAQRTIDGAGADPFKDLQIRFTYRTARVMSAVASRPGINNREVGEIAGVHDQGQMSKLLRRLQHNGLIYNHRPQHAKGEPNAWTLTNRGHAIHTAIDTPT